MAVVSMTGYGTGEAVYKGLKIRIELSSVNRKHFDLRLTLPKNLVCMEAKARGVIAEYVSRGYVSGTVRIDDAENVVARPVFIDEGMARSFIKNMRRAGKTFGLKDDLSLSSLMRMPDVVKFNDPLSDVDKLWPALKKLLQGAVSAMVGMRESEGRELERDMRRRLSALKKHLEVIERAAPTVKKKYEDRLKSGLKKHGVRTSGDNEKILKEIFIFIDRSDISEEIVRLRSHFKHAYELIDSAEHSGRALDFLCQEMFREINTIGSKSNDTGISTCVVKFKTDLECFREQVQNIE